MKYLLLLLLSLNDLSGIALAAPTSTSTATSSGTATGTSSGTATATSTSTSTGTSTATATESYEEKFGETWLSTKKNEDLLKDKELVDESTKDGNLSQEDANKMISTTLYKCVEVALNGREDEVCKTDANHPECVGVNRATQNATNCLEYFPGTTECKRHGTTEYKLEEWIAVAGQFQNQMVDCAKRKYSFDNKKNVAMLNGLTEMMGASNYLSKLPDGPTMKGSSFNVDSKVSGSIKSDMNVTSLDWESLASRIKDGASYLGYQDGDILRASIKGESFASIVTESPFAQKLNYENRAKLEEGLADSKMISQRVVETHREKTGSEPLAALAVAENSESTDGSSGVNEVRIAEGDKPANGTQPEERNATGGAVAPGATEAQANPAGAAASPLAAGSRAMLEAERLDAVAQAAALARMEKKAYRAPASVEHSKVEDLLDTTLFARISQTYRRKSSGMRTFDTRSGDLIRSIEKPEIFRNL